MGKIIWFFIGGFIGYMAGFSGGIYHTVQGYNGVIVKFIANIKFLIENVL
jgi:hypothetical protein